MINILYLFSRFLSYIFGKKEKNDVDSPSDSPQKTKTLDAKWLKIAKSEIGTKEIRGEEHNPRVVQYYADAGHGWVKDDETAWCAAAVGSWLERSGFASSKSLAARSYLNWGKRLTKPKIGCIVVFSRGNPNGWQGHVGLYMGETDTHIKVLGGNQNNEVNISNYSKSRLLGYRWPVTAINSRTNVASAVGLAGAGSSALAVSLNELIAVSTELKGLSSYVPELVIVGSIVAILSYIVVIWARYQDLKDKGR